VSLTPGLCRRPIDDDAGAALARGTPEPEAAVAYAYAEQRGGASRFPRIEIDVRANFFMIE
jgi:hypothetical protein